MSLKSTLIQVAVVGLLATGLVAQNPCNPCGGKNPCNPCGEMNPCNPCGLKHPGGGHAPHVNPCDAKLGTVFHVADPAGRNSVTFTSEAPLEDIVGTTNEVQGYLVFDPSNPGRGGKGEFVVSVASLKTGIPLRDEHLRGAAWMDAARFPVIRYRVEGTRSIRPVHEDRDSKTWDMKLHGTFSMHGKKVPMGAEARVTWLRENDRTRQKMPGDLLAARATLKVPLKAFGISGPRGAGIVGNKISETIEVTVRFTGSSQAPTVANACNPCGEKNPCNPCGGMNPCGPTAQGGANPCNPCSR